MYSLKNQSILQNLIKMRSRVIALGFCFFIVFLSLILNLSSINCYLATGDALGAGYSTISVSEAKDLVSNTSELFILDVRADYEFEAGHIIGAYLIPHTEIINRQDELPDNKSHPILVYCRSGGRSVTASNTLVSLAYTQVYNMDNGFNAWKNAGYPYEIVTVVNPSTISENTTLKNTTVSKTDQNSTLISIITSIPPVTSITTAFEIVTILLSLGLFVIKGRSSLFWRKK